MQDISSMIQYKRKTPKNLYDNQFKQFVNDNYIKSNSYIIED
jgi:hypothetical protein